MVKTFFLSFIFLVILPITAQAEYEGNTKTVHVIEDSSNLFPRHFYTIEIFNNPQISESKFTMRLASYGVVSGCATTYGGTNELKERFGTIKLTISDAELTLDRDPRYSNYDCEIKENRAFTDVELDRDELISKDIKYIKLKSESYGEFAKLDIKTTKEKFELSVKSQAGNFMTTFWFFPKDTVILHVPSAKLDQDVRKLIKNFGLLSGLTPMEKSFKGFELPYNANSYAFFKNSKGDIVNRLSSIGENLNVGDLIATRTIYDNNGAKEDYYELPIYATLPGKKIIEKKDDY